MKQQIRSKQRVADHGEVFTREQEVNAMLDMIDSRTNNNEITYLEPACGNGNFLIEILKRKIDKICQTNRQNLTVWKYEFYTVQAVSRLYGIDILADNVDECRKRLFNYVKQEYEKLFPNQSNKQYEETIRFILNLNIVHGNALTMTYEIPDEQGNFPMLVFSHWAPLEGRSRLTCKIKRHDFTYKQLIEARDEPFQSLSKQQYYSHYFLDIQNAKAIDKL